MGGGGGHVTSLWGVKTKVTAHEMSLTIIICRAARSEPQLLVHLSTLGQTRFNGTAALHNQFRERP